MIVLDLTIVSVALPSIKADLRLSQDSLVWVVNAYLLSFGGLLLLGGRLGDLFGPRRLFLVGIALFTLASLACGLANSELLLIAGRTIQGLGGAIVAAVSLSLTMALFTESSARARAVGVIGFVNAGGGSLGLLLGGLLTAILNWHWIFLINIPVGISVCVLCLKWLPADAPALPRSVDFAGALTITTAVMLFIHAIVRGNEAGWVSGDTVLPLVGAAFLLILFVMIETRVSAPLVPMDLFRRRNVSIANIAAALTAAAILAWSFVATLYLQTLLKCTPLQTGLAFLPNSLITGTFSLGISARLIARFGLRLPLTAGLVLMAAALLLFARAPESGRVLTDVIPGMVIMGLGYGMAFNPLLLAAVSEVADGESGVASGIFNTAFLMGGALGLAIVASVSAVHADKAPEGGANMPLALNNGYHAAFLVSAMFAMTAALLSYALVRDSRTGLKTELQGG